MTAIVFLFKRANIFLKKSHLNERNGCLEDEVPLVWCRNWCLTFYDLVVLSCRCCVSFIIDKFLNETLTSHSLQYLIEAVLPEPSHVCSMLLHLTDLMASSLQGFCAYVRHGAPRRVILTQI